jgi:ribosomal protein S19
MRHCLYGRTHRATQIEMHFVKKHCYYLLLDPEKAVDYSVFSRNSMVSRAMVGEFARVYRGMRWRTVFLTSWHVGFKLGEFAKTRIRAGFKSKTLTKKKQKQQSDPNAAFLKEMQISKLRLIKSGKVRKQRLVHTAAPTYATVGF